MTDRKRSSGRREVTVTVEAFRADPVKWARQADRAERVVVRDANGDRRMVIMAQRDKLPRS